MKKADMLRRLNKEMEEQVPDAWDDVQEKIYKWAKQQESQAILVPGSPELNRKRPLYRKLSLAAAACLIAVSAFTFTPAAEAIQAMYDKIFSSRHIDDAGARKVAEAGQGQALNQVFYDKQHDITVRFESIMMDDKETKLLLTYQSKKTNLQDYYIDLFEGESRIHLVSADGQKKRLQHVGWGSRYYDSKENKVAEALSFESLQAYAGQEIRLEVENLTIYGENERGSVQTIWPFSFQLEPSAVSKRKIMEVNQTFTFQNQTYTIRRIELSALETRVVAAGSDIRTETENGQTYKVMSELEKQFLHARRFDKQYGYRVDDSKLGVFLQVSGKKVDPIFSKGEVEGADDEYIMFFAPVKDHENATLQVGRDLEIPLVK